MICQRQSGGTTSYYGYDGNGNVRFLTATNATVSDTYVYDLFGDLIASTGTTPNNYRYTGEQYDPNLGFYYLRDRYSNPNTGRLMSRDSFEGSVFDPPSLHRYTYCANNPANCIDPSGKENILVIGIAVLIVVAIAAFTFVTAPTRGKISKQQATPADFKILIKILESGINQMQKNLDANPNSMEELTRNLVSVGQNSIFYGNVTDAGKQQSPGVQKLIYYFERASEFNDLPGVSGRESRLLELQNVERARIGFELEINRSQKAIEFLKKEMLRRSNTQ